MKKLLGILMSVFVLAAILRLWAAKYEYPIPGDGAHFVQYGMTLANGDGKGLSSYWSQGMVLLAAFCHRLGGNPGTGLQLSNVFYGSLLVLPAGFIAWFVTKSRMVSIITGLLVAVTPGLIQYSACAFSEVSFMFWLYLGLLFCVVFLLKRKAIFLIGSSVSMGISLYYKSPDACVWALWICGCIFLSGLIIRRIRSAFLWGVTYGVLFLAMAIPLVYLTHKDMGKIAIGAKGHNIAWGDYAYDSKAMSALNQPVEYRDGRNYQKTHGTLAYMWYFKKELVRRFSGNMFRALREYSNHIFANAFRMGMGWFVLLIGCMGICLLLQRDKWVFWVLLFGGVTFHTSMVSMTFIRDRYIIENTPVFLLGTGLCVTLLWKHSSKIIRWGLAVFITYYITQNSLYAKYAGDRFFSNGHNLNIVKLAEHMRGKYDQAERLMMRFPHLVIHFHTNDFFNYIELPYGTSEEVGKHAVANDVTLAVLSDKFYQHWPIHRIMDGSDPMPEGWEELERITYSGNEKRGFSTETFAIYRVHSVP